MTAARGNAEGRRREPYCRCLLEASADAVAVTDLAGRITDANAALERLTGRSRDALAGSRLAGHTAEPARADDMVGRALRDGRVADVELTAARPDGSRRLLSCDASSFAGSDGGLRGIVVTARDVTERLELARTRQRAQDRAHQLEQERVDFVSRVSHELRSPLTSLLGYLELLRAGRAGPLTTEQRQVTDIIQRSGDKLRAQVENLLLFSRVDAAAVQVIRTPVRLAPLIRGARDAFLPAVFSRQLDIRLDLDESIVLDADAGQLEQVMSNLVSNAVKFTQPGGRIAITARADGGEAVIEVRDSGVGVPADELPRLFSRFFRSSASAEIEVGGIGLGLYIVKQIVEAHGGDVAAASTPGAGSVFTVRLPLRPGARAPGQARSEIRPSPGRRGCSGTR